MENLQQQGRTAQPPWRGMGPESGEARAAAPRARAAAGQAGHTQLSTVLAGVSLAIGAAALLAPRAAARASGMANWPWLMRAIGLRELACGFGLLAQPASPVWRWTRVAGDAMDMTVLGAAAFAPSSQRGRLLAAAAIAGGIAALDVRASAPVLNKPSSQPLPGQKGARRVQKSVTVNRPPAECYAFWRQFERFPTFMQHVESITVQDEKRSHWRVKAPLGGRVEFDARITDERPNELIAWHSEEGADVEHAGQVSFAPAPGGRGTIVQLQMDYRPPAGRAAAAVAKLFGEEPSQQAADDLRRFKQLIETGEIPTTRGQSHGVRSLKATLFTMGVEQ